MGSRLEYLVKSTKHLDHKVVCAIGYSKKKFTPLWANLGLFLQCFDDLFLLNCEESEGKLTGVCEPPKGVETRVVPGLKGVAYLDPDLPFFHEKTTYMSDIIKLLAGLGHELKAAPYDFRKSPTLWKDTLFVEIKAQIEEFNREGIKPNLVAHSFGGAVVSRLLYWLRDTEGKAYLDERIGKVVFLAPVLAGSPLAYGAIATGAFIAKHVAIPHTQSYNVMRGNIGLASLRPDPQVFGDACYIHFTKNDDCLTTSNAPEIMRKHKRPEYGRMFEFLNEEYPFLPHPQIDPLPHRRIHVWYGDKVQTPLRFKISKDDRAPEPANKWNFERFVDGDNCLPAMGVRYFGNQWCSNYGYEECDVKAFNGVDHNNMVHDKAVMKELHRVFT
ncbi:hypothetical protein PCE1_002517 [Barthelona sp. PCE]